MKNNPNINKVSGFKKVSANSVNVDGVDVEEFKTFKRITYIIYI